MCKQRLIWLGCFLGRVIFMGVTRMNKVNWVSFHVVVNDADGTRVDVTEELPAYLLGEITAHVNELADIRNGIYGETK
jgi:hypothetical protein